MDPATPPTPQTNAEVIEAISKLQSSIDSRFEAQKAEFEERLKPVETISETLEQARRNQIEAQERERQQNQPTWQPKSWDEIPKMIEERASAIAEKTIKDRDQRLTAEQQRQANEESQLEAEIDRSLQQLEQNGYLPSVGNPNDFNDPGVAARRELLGAASYMGTPELDKVADTLTQMHRNNLVFDPQTKTYISADNTLMPLPGKFAPVGNGSTSSPSRFAGPTTRDLRHSTMDDLVALAEQRGYGPAPTSVVDQPGGF